MGIDQSEFTNAGGTGTVRVYQENGAVVNIMTPAAGTLYDPLSTLEEYDDVLLPCTGAVTKQTDTDLTNMISYADEGGRILTSHYGYTWLVNNGEFNNTATWDPQVSIEDRSSFWPYALRVAR
jgi:hypothetical protein